MVEDLGGYVRLVGVTISSSEHVDQLIPREELAQLQIARVEADFAAPPRGVFLGLEARRYHFDFDVVEDLSEEGRWQQEEIWETLSVTENCQELEREICTLEELIRQA